MSGGQIAAAVVGAVVTYVIATALITNFVTGTTTGDVLLQNTVPIVAAAGVCIWVLMAFFRK